MRVSQALLAVACAASSASALSSPRANGLRRRTFIDGIEVDLSNLTSISTGIPSIRATSVLTDKLATSSVSIPDKDKDHDELTTVPVFPDKDSNNTSLSSSTVIPDKDKTTTGLIPSKDAATTSAFVPNSSASGSSNKEEPSSVLVTVLVNTTVSVVPIPPLTASITLRRSTSSVSVTGNFTATISDKENTIILTPDDKTTHIVSVSTTGNPTASIPDKDEPTRSLTSGKIRPTGILTKDFTSSPTHFTTSTVRTETIGLVPVSSNNHSLTLITLTPSPVVSESNTLLPSNNPFAIGPSSSVGSETPISSSISVSYNVVLHTLTLPGPSGSPTVVVISGTSPAVPTETPESTGVALTWTEIQSLETISLPQTTTSGSANDKDSSGTSSSPSTTASSGGTSSGSTTLVVPLWTPDMLGSAYGGGYITTPSIYITLSGTLGFTEGVPPGYGSTFRPTPSHSGFAVTTRTRPVSRTTSFAIFSTAPFANSTIPLGIKKSSTTDDKDQVTSSTDKSPQSKDQTTALPTTDLSSEFEDKTTTVSTTSEPSKTGKQTQPLSDKTSNTDDKVSTTTATTTVVSCSSTNELGSIIQTSITLVKPSSSAAFGTSNPVLLTTSTISTSSAPSTTIVAPTGTFLTATTVFVTTLKNSAGSALTFSSTFTALIPVAQTTVSQSAEVSTSAGSTLIKSSGSVSSRSTISTTQTPGVSSVEVSSPISSIPTASSASLSADFTTQSTVFPSVGLSSTTGSILVESTFPSGTTSGDLPIQTFSVAFGTPPASAGTVVTTSSVSISGSAVVGFSSSTGPLFATSSAPNTQHEGSTAGLSASLIITTPAALSGSVYISSNAPTGQTESATTGGSTSVAGLTNTGTPTAESFVSTASDSTNSVFPSTVYSTGPTNIASNSVTAQIPGTSTGVAIPVVVPFTATNLAGSVLITSSISTLSLPASAVGVPQSEVTFTDTDTTGSVSPGVSSTLLSQGESSSVLAFSSTSSPLEQGSPSTISSIVVGSTITSPAGSVIATSSISVTQSQGPTPTESPVVIVYNTTNPAGSLISTTSTATALVPSSTSDVLTSSEQPAATSPESVLPSVTTTNVPAQTTASTMSSFEQSANSGSSLSIGVSSQPLDTITLPGGNPFPEPTNTAIQFLDGSEGVQPATEEATGSIQPTSSIPGVPSVPEVTSPAALQPANPLVTDFGNIVVNGTTFALTNPTPTAVPFEGSTTRISSYSIAAIAGILMFLSFLCI